MGEATLPAEAGALYSYPEFCEPEIDVTAVLSLCVGDFPELSELRDAFLDSEVLSDVRLDRDASACNCWWWWWWWENAGFEKGFGGPVGASPPERPTKPGDEECGGGA